jgi:hypothetical protein
VGFREALRSGNSASENPIEAAISDNAVCRKPVFLAQALLSCLKRAFSDHSSPPLPNTYLRLQSCFKPYTKIKVSILCNVKEF